MLADSTPARTQLGWEPQVSQAEGLKRTMAFIQEHFRPEHASRYIV
ncbi:MAG TPA: hypothetical protein VGK74_21765 [Symbiobacteriaceae bacterium]